MEYANVDEDNAIDMLYNSGLKIYSAQNVALQEGFEELLKNNWQGVHVRRDIWSGACLMEYDGRILAVNSNKVDSDGNYIEKTENRGWNNVSTTVNSPGSSIKPIGVYAPAIETSTSPTAPCSRMSAAGLLRRRLGRPEQLQRQLQRHGQRGLRDHGIAERSDGAAHQRDDADAQLPVPDGEPAHLVADRGRRLQPERRFDRRIWKTASACAR